MLAPAVRNRAARIDAVQSFCWSVGLALRANLPAPEAHTMTKSQIPATVKAPNTGGDDLPRPRRASSRGTSSEIFPLRFSMKFHLKNWGGGESDDVEVVLASELFGYRQKRLRPFFFCVEWPERSPNHRPKPKGQFMIWYILLGVLAVIGIIALIASTKPNEWTIQRQEAIPGTPAKVFPHVDDPHKFNEWSPWAKLDPNIKLTYGGHASGSGAHCSWEGNGKVGVGKMRITESRPNDLVRYRFDFYKPLNCTSTHEFALKPENSQTTVTWTAKGNAPFVFKLMLVFASADRMMGDNFEQGLANLKAVVAAGPSGGDKTAETVGAVSAAEAPH